ncbi:hypothetical protein D3C86_1660660 [compost metagenome]
MLRCIPFVGIQLFFFLIDHFREATDQILHLVGEVLRHIKDELGGGFRSLALLQLRQQLFGGAQRPQTQGNHPLGGTEDPHRDHVFRLGTRIKVYPTQK